MSIATLDINLQPQSITANYKTLSNNFCVILAQSVNCTNIIFFYKQNENHNFNLRK